MRLKPIVASVLLLGFSGAAFAATSSNANIQMQMNSLQTQINALEKNINQNNGGTTTGGGTALQKRLASCPNWYDSISVSGLINIDGILSSRREHFISNTEGTGGNTVIPGFSGPFDPSIDDFRGPRSASDLALDNADIFVDARVNSWTKAHIGLNYQDNNNNYILDNPKSSFGSNSNNSLIIKPWMGSLIDEAYVTFGDFCRSPFYFRVGKQYLNFGNYDRYATVPTFTQLLSQTNDTAATLGFVFNGFYGSVYGFRGIPSRMDNSFGTKNINNWGANLGWSMKRRHSSLNVQAGYLNNMADVDYVSESVDWSQSNATLSNGYTRPVGALSLDVSGNLGMVDAYGHYVTALENFDPSEINPSVKSTNPFQSGQITTRGAQPSALVLGAGLTTNVMNHKTRFGLDYQYSWDALLVGLYGIPQARIEGTIDMLVNKNVDVGVYLDHDQDYSTWQGGTGTASTAGILHLGVMFA